MADIAIPEDQIEPLPAPPAKASLLPLLAILLFLTSLGVGAGCLFGLLIGAPASRASIAAEADEQGAGGRVPDGANLKALPSIVTNLGAPGNGWIRLEASIVLDGDAKEDTNVLTARIAEDLVAFLRTVSLSQIEGGSGLLHLREDLKDRIRIRSGGKARDLIIQALVVE